MISDYWEKRRKLREIKQKIFNEVMLDKIKEETNNERNQRTEHKLDR
jgi:hypothetical protein